ncbi:MAG: hypothetical protein MJY99_00670 [Fibrobacter sp.]|nr:hypothetical protein [Fibrobacter sp.]
MKTTTKILVSIAALSLLACSEDNPSAASDTSNIEKQANVDNVTSDSTKKEEPATPDTNQNIEPIAPEETTFVSTPDYTLIDDIKWPESIDFYSDQSFFKQMNASMDSSVIAYYTRNEYAKLGLSLQPGLNKIDFETLSKIPEFGEKLSIRGNTESCNYYVVDNEIPDVRTDNMLTSVSQDSIVILNVRPYDGKCESHADFNREAFFLEICGDSLSADISIANNVSLDTARECNIMSNNFGKWFRTDVYNSYDELPEESPIEMDLPGSCYSPCAPGAQACVAVCADHPYEITNLLDSLSKAYSKEYSLDQTILLNNDAEYAFFSSGEEVFNMPADETSGACKVNLYENGTQKTVEGTDDTWQHTQIILKTIRSLPIKIELSRGFFKNDEDAAKELSNLRMQCEDHYGLFHNYDDQESSQIAAVCAMVNYDKTSLKQEVEALVSSCEAGE